MPVPAWRTFAPAVPVAAIAVVVAALCAPAQAQDLVAAGQVTFATGEARVAGEGGKAAQALKKGDTVYVGQVIETADAAHVHVRLVDGAFLSVRPKSRLRVEAYDFNPAAPEASRVKYTLEDGIARSITGRAGQANKAGFRFNTPVAAIGIRGTDFVVQTTASVTRAAVNSGRIVMSGFGDSCSPNALGPCGNGVAELGVREGVRNNYYLEVRGNQAHPVLVPAQASSDALLPKREPVTGPEAAVPVPTSAEARTTASTAEVLSQTVAKEVAATTGVESLVRPTVFWGRWSVYQGGDADRVTAEDLLRRADLSVAQVNTGFALFTANAPVTVPEAGRYSFRLADSEAYIQTGRQLESAKVTRGQLDVNFADRTFSTGLNVVARSAALDLQSTGAISANGTFNSGAGNMDVRGTFQGDTGQAGYLFRSLLDGGKVAVGAVRWVR